MITIKEMNKNLELLKTTRGREYYLQKIIDNAPKGADLDLVNLALGDVYLEKKDTYSAIKIFKKLELEESALRKRFAKLGELYEAQKGGRDLEKAIECYDVAGMEDKVRSCTLKLLDDQQPYDYAGRNFEFAYEAYQELGFSLEQTLDRILERFDKDDYSKEKKNPVLFQIVKKLEETEKTSLLEEYSIKLIEDYVLRENDRSYDAFFALKHVGKAKQVIVPIFFDQLIEQKKVDDAINLFKWIPKKLKSQAKDRIIKSYTSGKVHCSFDQPKRLRAAKAFLKKYKATEEHWVMLGQSFERAQCLDEALDCYLKTNHPLRKKRWLERGDNMSEIEKAIESYENAGLSQKESHLRIAERDFISNDPITIRNSYDLFKKAGLSSEELLEKQNALLKRKFSNEDNEFYTKGFIELYEKFGLDERARNLRLKHADNKIRKSSEGYGHNDDIGKYIEVYRNEGFSESEIKDRLIENLPIHNGFVEQLQEAGIDDPEFWSRFGDKIRIQRKRDEYYTRADEIYELAGYKTGTPEQMSILADEYEYNFKPMEVLELRKKVEGLK